MATSYLAVAGLSAGMLLSGYYLGKITFSILRDREKKSRHNIDDLAEEYLSRKDMHEKHKDYAGSHLEPEKLLKRLRELDKELQENGLVRLNAIEAAFVLENLRDHIVKSFTGDHYLLSVEGLHAFRSFFDEMNLSNFVREIRKIERKILPAPGEKPSISAESLFFKARNGMIQQSEDRNFFTLSMLEDRSIVCKVVPSKEVEEVRRRSAKPRKSATVLRRDQKKREYILNEKTGVKYVYDDDEGLIVEYTKGRPEEKKGNAAIAEMVNKLLEHNIKVSEEQQRRMEAMNEAQTKKMELLLSMVEKLARQKIDVKGIGERIEGADDGSLDEAIEEARRRVESSEIEASCEDVEEFEAKCVMPEPKTPGINAPELEEIFGFADEMLGMGKKEAAKKEGKEQGRSEGGMMPKNVEREDRSPAQIAAGFGKSEIFSLFGSVVSQGGSTPFNAIVRLSNGSYFLPYFYFAYAANAYGPFRQAGLVSDRIDMVKLDELAKALNGVSERAMGKEAQMFHPKSANTLKMLLEWEGDRYCYDVLMLNRKFVSRLPKALEEKIKRKSVAVKMAKINPGGGELSGAKRPEMVSYRPAKGMADA